MSAKTKIVVLKMKELIYTAVFVGLAILLIAIGWAMFRGEKPTPNTSDNKDPQTTVNPHSDVDTSTSAAANQFIPGVYTAALPLGNQVLELEVIVDSTQIKSIRLVGLQDSVTAMYPLVLPSMVSLQEQILASQSTANIRYADNSKYTTYVLLQAINTALEKAAGQ